MSYRILFVDDEERVLQGLRRMLRPMRGTWDMTFSVSGAEALQIIQYTRPDVLVSDIRMPGIDGAQLLEEAMQLRPQMLRVALTGQSDAAMTLHVVQSTHQFLTKPCDPRVLKAMITRACTLSDQLNRPPLKHLVTGTGTLPSQPSAYEDLAEELGQVAPRLNVVGAIISSDMAMAAKVLQLVNSAFFAAGQSVTSPLNATTRLGIDTLRSLLEVGVFRPVQGTAVRSLRSVWDHAADTQANARAIATSEGWTPAAVDEAAAAGLLHDVGRLLLAEHYGEAYGDIIADAAQRGTDLGRAEEEGFGASHAAVGASLLGSWGLPDALVTAVRDHQPAELRASAAIDTSAVLRIADALAHEVDFVDEAACALVDDEIEPADALRRLAAWRAACAA